MKLEQKNERKGSRTAANISTKSEFEQVMREVEALMDSQLGNDKVKEQVSYSLVCSTLGPGCFCSHMREDLN